MRLSVSLLTLVFVMACSNAETERLKETTKASYDKATGRLKELTYDADKNGRIDTWTEMDGAKAVRSRLDRNEDGKIDRWEYYDDNGHLLKVGFSRKDDGKADAWAYSGPDGRVERIDISSVADETKIDRWERYDASGLVAADEDANRDGVADKWETYDAGVLKTAGFDEDADGRPDRRLTYQGGTLVAIESVPDAAGRFTKRTDVKPDDSPHQP